MKDPKNPKNSLVTFNSLIDGSFLDSPASSITAGAKNDGINAWSITQVGLKTDALDAVSELKVLKSKKLNFTKLNLFFFFFFAI
jgi:hypothetical protein